MKKPAPDEVQAYWGSASLHGDPADFYDHFESNGWMVGKVPMKDWKAAARNWSRNDIKWNGGQSTKVTDSPRMSTLSEDVRKEEVLRELEMERKLREKP